MTITESQINQKIFDHDDIVLSNLFDNSTDIRHIKLELINEPIKSLLSRYRLEFITNNTIELSNCSIEVCIRWMNNVNMYLLPDLKALHGNYRNTCKKILNSLLPLILNLSTANIATDHVIYDTNTAPYHNITDQPIDSLLITLNSIFNENILRKTVINLILAAYLRLRRYKMMGNMIEVAQEMKIYEKEPEGKHLVYPQDHVSRCTNNINISEDKHPLSLEKIADRKDPPQNQSPHNTELSQNRTKQLHGTKNIPRASYSYESLQNKEPIHDKFTSKQKLGRKKSRENEYSHIKPRDRRSHGKTLSTEKWKEKDSNYNNRWSEQSSLKDSWKDKEVKLKYKWQDKQVTRDRWKDGESQAMDKRLRENMVQKSYQRDEDTTDYSQSKSEYKNWKNTEEIGHTFSNKKRKKKKNLDFTKNFHKPPFISSIHHRLNDTSDLIPKESLIFSFFLCVHHFLHLRYQDCYNLIVRLLPKMKYRVQQELIIMGTISGAIINVSSNEQESANKYNVNSTNDKVSGSDQHMWSNSISFFTQKVESISNQHFDSKFDISKNQNLNVEKPVFPFLISFLNNSSKFEISYFLPYTDCHIGLSLFHLSVVNMLQFLVEHLSSDNLETALGDNPKLTVKTSDSLNSITCDNSATKKSQLISLSKIRALFHIKGVHGDEWFFYLLKTIETGLVRGYVSINKGVLVCSAVEIFPKPK